MKSSHPLRTFRRRQKLSQSALAAKLGVRRETVARWETGVRKVDKDLLPNVAALTGIPAHKLRPDLATIFQRPASHPQQGSPP